MNAAQNAFCLEGKTILVTGASSGLGQQIAWSCAQRGARLIITGRDTARLRETFEQLEGTGHLQFQAELTNPADREALVKACGTVNGVVHSAGKQMLVPIRLLTEQLMTEMYNVNFLAPVMLTQALLRANAVAQQGSIIFLASISAHIGTPGVGPYAAMKSALLGIIRCLAREQAKRKIRVNGISPSVVPTALWGGIGEHLEPQRVRHPLGLGTPEDVANGAVYLLSDASRWVTGTSLVMDGGVVL